MYPRHVVRSTRSVVSVAAALVLAVAASGCARATAGTDVQSIRPTTTVQVSNQGWSDVVVYVLRSGMKWRLGMVTSQTSRTFEMPRGVLPEAGSLRLLADPIGSKEHLTAPFQVTSGQRVALTLQNVLSMSYVSVWAQ